jgi:hypothetical protein
MAAGWMWTSAEDLMRWAIAVADARDGKPRPLLSRTMATAMLTRQKDLYGLGPLLEGSGRAFAFSHGGNNPGYTTQITYFPETRQGVAILVNKVGADLLIDEIMRAVASEYGWPAHQPRRVRPAALTASELAAIAGTYSLQFPGAPEPTAVPVSIENGRLFLSAPPILVHEELIPLSATRFISATWGISVEFQRSSFTLTYGDNTFTATRATARH